MALSNNKYTSCYDQIHTKYQIYITPMSNDNPDSLLWLDDLTGPKERESELMRWEKEMYKSVPGHLLVRNQTISDFSGQTSWELVRAS